MAPGANYDGSRANCEGYDMQGENQRECGVDMKTVDAPTPRAELLGRPPALRVCPFCGVAPQSMWRRVNPHAGCATDGCWGAKLPRVALDDPKQVAAWNTRAPAPVSCIRIEWYINGASGHGEWYPYMPELYSSLTGAAKVLCETYGAGTHWVEASRPKDNATPGA